MTMAGPYSWSEMGGYVRGMDGRKRARLNKSTTNVNMRAKV